MGCVLISVYSIFGFGYPHSIPSKLSYKMLSRSCLQLNYVCLCPTCEARRLSVEVLRAETKGSSLFTSKELSKVKQVSKDLKDGFCECKRFETRPVSGQRTCHQCNKIFSLAFFNSDQVLGSGSYIGNELQPVPHPKTPLLRRSRNKGVTFVEGDNNPDWVKQDKMFNLNSKPTTPGMRVCHFCQKEVLETIAQKGIVGFAIQTFPFHKIYSHTGYACPNHVRKLQPFVDGNKKITNQNFQLESKG